MNFFTYNDYMDYEKNIKTKKEMEKEKKKIEYEKKYKQKKYDINKTDIIDEIIKNLLNDKEEVSIFISEFLKIKTEQIQEELKEIKNFSIKDKLYQQKRKEFYFLIKYQTQIDYHISYKILISSMDFMKEWEKNRNRKQLQFPILAPIIIYTGTQKWNTKENFEKEKLKYITYEKNGMYLKYNLIDTNQYKTLELLRMDSLIANMMALKRYSSSEKRKEILTILIDNSERMEKFLKLNKIKKLIY